MKTCSIVLALTLSALSAGEPHRGFGISSWGGWRPGQISKTDCPELRSVPPELRARLLFVQNAVAWRELYDHRSDADETTSVLDNPEHAATVKRLEDLVAENYASLK